MDPPLRDIILYRAPGGGGALGPEKAVRVCEAQTPYSFHSQFFGKGSPFHYTPSIHEIVKNSDIRVCLIRRGSGVQEMRACSTSGETTLHARYNVRTNPESTLGFSIFHPYPPYG